MSTMKARTEGPAGAEAEMAAVVLVAHRADDGGWGIYSPHVRAVFAHGDSLETAVEDWRVAVNFAREEGGWEVVDRDVVVEDEPDAVVFTRIPVRGPIRQPLDISGFERLRLDD